MNTRQWVGLAVVVGAAAAGTAAAISRARARFADRATLANNQMRRVET